MSKHVCTWLVCFSAGLNELDLSKFTTVDKISEEMFGEKTQNLARLKYLKTALGLGEIFTIGWNCPRHEMDDGVGNVLKTKDFHAWYVDCTGDVLDYPIEKLSSKHKTKNVIWRPWDIALAAKIFSRLEIEHEKWLESQGLNEEDLLGMANMNKFPRNDCYHHAKLIRDTNPRSMHW